MNELFAFVNNCFVILGGNKWNEFLPTKFSQIENSRNLFLLFILSTVKMHNRNKNYM